MEVSSDLHHFPDQESSEPRNAARDSKIVDVQQKAEIVQTPRAKSKTKPRNRRRAANAEDEDPSKRRCVSTACIACRKRKSKCDGNTPACAACSQVYNTECIYDPNSDHRRKGVYKNDTDNLKTKDTTLHTLIHAILNYSEEDVPALVQEIRTCESLDDVAEKIILKEQGLDIDEDLDDDLMDVHASPTFESNLYAKMGDLRLEAGAVRYIGGTSNLIHVGDPDGIPSNDGLYPQQDNAILSWTRVTDDPDLVTHLLDMYFTWHYTFFTTLSKSLFYRDFELGQPQQPDSKRTQYCTPILVNAMLALGCHFTAHTGAREVADDSATAGDHFFREAKRLLMEDDVLEKPRLATVQALALMSVREAGCGREAKGWVYSGMSFRMSQDMGLHLDSSQLTNDTHISGDEADEDARKITFWGCFLFDKCWSNYLGRLPQLPTSIVTTAKFEVFPDEDAADWSPYTDSGFANAHSQPARTRAVALGISKLCEISNDLMQYFYNPTDMDKIKGKQSELKKLSDIHTRLESWRRGLPKELEPREGVLSSVLVMHMFFQLLYIHLFRPFLKYTAATSPLPTNVSPRKLCTQAAAMISKLLRLYKRSHGLRQICNIAVYIAHSACTIHLLNLPDKNARRDIIHGVKHLEEMAEGWLGARRSLGILSVLASRWNAPLPYEAETVLTRTDAKFGPYKRDAQSPASELKQPTMSSNNNNRSSSSSNPYAHSNSNRTHQPTGGSTFASFETPALRYTSGSSHSALGLHSLAQQQQEEQSTGAGHITAPGNLPTKRQATASDILAIPPRSEPSPSAMFGGIEQLLRDSQDWVYKDQAQFGTGFGNWHGVDDDSTAWANTRQSTTATTTTTTTNAMHDAAVGVQGSPATTTTTTTAIVGPPGLESSRGSHVFATPAGGAAAAAAATMHNIIQDSSSRHWTNGVDGMATTNMYNSMMTYNEDEWYQ